MVAGWQEAPAWVAAGWTMIQFLWIGTVIGLLELLLGWTILRRASSQIRYLCALATLVALAITAGVIYQQQLRQVRAVRALCAAGPGPDSPFFLEATKAAEVGASLPVAPSSPEHAKPSNGRAGAKEWRAFLEVLAARVPWLWMVGTPVMLVVLGIGCRGVNRARRGSEMLDEGWVVDLCQELSRSLQLTRRVTLALSEGVLSPILLGIIRPIILLPVPVLTGCSPEQLKMILLHELAHVRRWDAAVNLVQRLIEALLFFHPMVWVISRWVRAEREECCDAIVVKRTGNAQGYAEALAQLASAAPEVASAAALAAARHPVVRRIRRILQLDDRWVPLPGAIAAGAMALLTILALPTLASFALGGLHPGTWAQDELATVRNGTAIRDATAPLVGVSIPDDQAGDPTPAGFGVTASSPGRQRVLAFPKGRSLGQIGIREADASGAVPYYLSRQEESGWVWLGPARGAVTIPEGAQARLSVSGASALRDLSPLAGLAPNDLETLTISCSGDPQLDADEAILPFVSKFTGLKSLTLEQVNLSQVGIALLRNLRSLKHMSIRSAQIQPGQAVLPQLDERCVEQLAQFTGLESLCLAGPRVTDEALVHLAKLSGLEELDLWCPKVRGPGLAYLEKLPSLRCLRLGGGELDDSGLAALGRLRSLQVLDLGKLKITDDGLEHLGALVALEELRLNGTEISDRGLAHLRSLSSLKRLELSKGGRSTQIISDAGAAYLEELKSLEHLSLWNLDFTDAGLAHLVKLPHLKTLVLPTATYVDPKMDKFVYTDAGLETLSRLSELEQLMVGSPAITDAGLAHLAKLTRLKRLDVTAQRISNEGLRHLAGLTSLESLSIRGERLTISGLNRLNTLTGLRKLNLAGIVQDNQGVDLSSLRQLEELSIGMRRAREGRSFRADVYRDEDMAWLAGLKHLKWLQGIRGISELFGRVADELDIRHLTDDLLKAVLGRDATRGRQRVAAHALAEERDSQSEHFDTVGQLLAGGLSRRQFGKTAGERVGRRQKPDRLNCVGGAALEKVALCHREEAAERLRRETEGF